MRKDINPVIKFTRIRDVKAPKRGYGNDAGVDFYIPNYSEDFTKTLMAENSGTRIYSYKGEDGKLYIKIPPHGKITIPSGIKVYILDKDTYLETKNKSGIATKYNLIKTAEVVDADFIGEIFFAMRNLSDETVTIWTGMKLVQLIQKEYIRSDYQEVTNEEFDSFEKTDRGEGDRGSSGLD